MNKIIVFLFAIIVGDYIIASSPVTKVNKFITINGEQRQIAYNDYSFMSTPCRVEKMSKSVVINCEPFSYNMTWQEFNARKFKKVIVSSEKITSKKIQERK